MILMIFVVVGSVLLMVAIIGYSWLVFGLIIALIFAVKMMDTLDMVSVMGLIFKNLPLMIMVGVQVGVVVLTLMFSQVSLGIVFTVGGLYVLMCSSAFGMIILTVSWYLVGSYLVMWSVLPIGLFFMKTVGSWSGLIVIMLVVMRLL